MGSLLLLISFIFFSTGVFAQGIKHTSTKIKLPGSEISEDEYSIQNGDTIYKKYIKNLYRIENGDSILYIESFDVNRYWNIDRYLIKNGKKEKNGIQHEFDIAGNKVYDIYCSSETGRCNTLTMYTYYPNGNLIAIVTTVNSKREGSSFFYHNNGQLKNHLEFKNDRLWNVLAYYDQHGNILDPGNFCDGNGELRVYSVSGRLIKIKNYKNGRERFFGF